MSLNKHFSDFNVDVNNGSQVGTDLAEIHFLLRPSGERPRKGHFYPNPQEIPRLLVCAPHGGGLF